MKLFASLAVLCAAAPSFALAQAEAPLAPQGREGGTIAQLLAGGYDIKAAFVNANVSYVFLQKGASAYMCKSVQGAACEKLN